MVDDYGIAIGILTPANSLAVAWPRSKGRDTMASLNLLVIVLEDRETPAESFFCKPALRSAEGIQSCYVNASRRVIKDGVRRQAAPSKIRGWLSAVKFRTGSHRMIQTWHCSSNKEHRNPFLRSSILNYQILRS